MRTEAKLAHLAGSDAKSLVLEVVTQVKRAWITKAERRDARPLRDVDGWSDQSEVAFYEEGRGPRA